MLVMKVLLSFVFRLIAIALFLVSFVLGMTWLAGFVVSILASVVSALTWVIPLAIASYLWHWIENRDFNTVIAQALAKARDSAK